MKQHNVQHQGIKSRIVKYFKKKFSSDLADAVLTTTVIAMPFFIVIGGYAIDTSKNSFLRNAHYSQAQTAAQSSVRTLDARGSLNADTIRVFHDNLYREWDGDHETALWRGENNCSEYDGETFPSYTVKFQAKNHEGSSDRDTTSGTFQYTHGEDFDQKLQDFIHNRGLDYNESYRVISAEVRTSSQNVLLGAFGMPCQAFTAKVNAGAFNEYR